MKLQMAAIALVSAMLGGVFGIAVWRKVDDTPKHVAVLSDQVDVLFAETRRLTGNDTAFVQTMSNMLADLGGEMYKAGLLDEKNTFIPRWWCIGQSGHCDRSMEACEKTRKWVAEQDTGRVIGECNPRRIAWCGGVRGWNCFAHRATCIEVSKAPYESLCLGSE